MIEEILEKLKQEKERVTTKFKKGIYTTNDYRARCSEIAECVDIVIDVAKKEYTEDEINTLIKEYLRD